MGAGTPRKLVDIMTAVVILVNALPPDLPPERATELLKQYRRERDLPAADAPPRWYIEQLITALETLAADRQVAA